LHDPSFHSPKSGAAGDEKDHKFQGVVGLGGSRKKEEEEDDDD